MRQRVDRFAGLPCPRPALRLWGFASQSVPSGRAPLDRRRMASARESPVLWRAAHLSIRETRDGGSCTRMTRSRPVPGRAFLFDLSLVGGAMIWLYRGSERKGSNFPHLIRSCNVRLSGYHSRSQGTFGSSFCCSWRQTVAAILRQGVLRDTSQLRPGRFFSGSPWQNHRADGQEGGNENEAVKGRRRKVALVGRPSHGCCGCWVPA